MSVRWQGLYGIITPSVYRGPMQLIHSIQVLGTHAGFLHILNHAGKRSKTYRPHQASVLELVMDVTSEFVATASMDGTKFEHPYIDLTFLQERLRSFR